MKPRRDPVPAQRDVLDVEPARLAAELSKLPPNDQLVVAARLGAEMSAARRERHEGVRDAGKDVAGHPVWRTYDGGRGYGNSFVSPEAIERRRAADLRLPEQRAASEAMVARAREACRAAEHPEVSAMAEEPPAAGAALERGR